MRIAVVGGSGFVGTRLIELIKGSHAITNIDKQKSSFFQNITHIADVRDVEAMKRELNGFDLVVLLAAEHRDDVTPVSLYYDVNVDGMKNVLAAMDYNGIKRIVFTSSVAIYGLNKNNPNEEHPADPFNHYGKTKWEAEKLLQAWAKKNPDVNVNILRPTVIFGERNRGNVYNLLKQISSGRFLMVGKGENVKSMCYVGNIVEFIKFLIENKKDGYNVFNYIDKPDMNMNQLVELVGETLEKHIPKTHFPYWLGMAGGYCFDFLAFILRKKLTVSSVRVKKFCAVTQFDSSKAMNSGFVPPYTIQEGLARTIKYEFTDNCNRDEVIFESE